MVVNACLYNFRQCLIRRSLVIAFTYPTQNPFFRTVMMSTAVCRQRSSELNRAKKDIKSEVEERYFLNAEEISQVRMHRRRRYESVCVSACIYMKKRKKR